MTVLKGSKSAIGLNTGKPITSDQSEEWVRPSDWLPLPVVVEGDQKVVGLMRIDDWSSNLVALSAAGNYTVDWGDGTVENFASGALASRNIAWSSVSASTTTSEGFRQVVITVTPQAGQSLTNINLRRNHPSTSNARYPRSKWLDIAISGPNLTSCIVSATFLSGTTHPLLQSIAFIGSSNISNGFTLFESFNLQSVKIDFNFTSLCNRLIYMFWGCTSLKSVPLFNTANVTDMEGMFNSCESLESVPLFDTANVQYSYYMFQDCTSLKSVPLFNTANVVNMDGMFIRCYSLKSVPLFNTANVTSMIEMFHGCTSLKSVPLFNTANVTSMDFMFFACTSLESVPLFNTGNVTSMSQMFNVCTALESVPLFNTVNVTNMSSMFRLCYSVQSIPELNMNKVTNTTTMMLNNNALQRIDIIPRRSFIISSTAPANAALPPQELDRVYTRLPSLLARTITGATGNGTTVTYTTSVAHGYLPGMVVTTTGITPTAYNLASVTIVSCPTTTTFTVASAATGTFSVNGTVTPASATLTVTDSWGTVSDTPSIATAKGWTVTG